MAQDRADKLRQIFGGPMSKEDVTFLRDIEGLIEFAIRNGLSLSVVSATIAHDVNELARYGFDLAEAKAKGFRAKVDGYAASSADDVGESAEDAA